MSIEQRVERLRAKLRAEGLDALMVTNPQNRRYLSGFTGHDDGADSAGTLLVGLRDIVLITDGRYSGQAAIECPGLRVVVREATVAPRAAEAARDFGARRVGFEATHLTVALRDDLAAAADEKVIPLDLVTARGLVEAQRVVKDDTEIAAIEQAVAITDATFAHLLDYLRPGLNEREVALEIERDMRVRGAEACAFAPIVASGPNAALPHAVPTDRVLARGETIILDMGARYAGYCSDMTRTLCLGQPPREIRAVYDLVLRAHVACEEGLRPGMTGKEADALARNVMEAAGKGDQFSHGTGHGLGLEIHEDPRLSRYGPEQTLAANMVVTVEPGAYISGWGGVRIEDTVVIGDDGPRVLTRAPKQLMLPLRRASGRGASRRARVASGVV
jgi:Xaa-Pro aminopeptidase